MGEEFELGNLAAKPIAYRLNVQMNLLLSCYNENTGI